MTGRMEESTIILGLVLVSIGMIQMIESDIETITVWLLLEDVGASAGRKSGEYIFGKCAAFSSVNLNSQVSMLSWFRICL